MNLQAKGRWQGKVEWEDGRVNVSTLEHPCYFGAEVDHGEKSGLKITIEKADPNKPLVIEAYASTWKEKDVKPNA